MTPGEFPNLSEAPCSFSYKKYDSGSRGCSRDQPHQMAGVWLPVCTLPRPLVTVTLLLGPLAGLCACGLASVFFDLVSLLAVNIPKLLGVTRRYHLLYTWRPSTSFTFSRRYRSVFGGLIWCQEETVSSAAVKGSVFEERSDSSS